MVTPWEIQLTFIAIMFVAMVAQLAAMAFVRVVLKKHKRKGE